MKILLTIIGLSVISLFASGCSLFGKETVETAPYDVLLKSDAYEVRHYDSLILASTAMNGDIEEQRSPFFKLFNYISGENDADTKIAMTSPVFMDENLSDNTAQTMSFVLPKSFTIENAPTPQNSDVTLEEITDYTVATIRFNGSLNKENIDENTQKLEQWIAEQGYVVTGASKAAGYNPPFTIPALKRNEILIPIERP